MLERKKQYNSTLHNISKKRLAEMQSGTYTPKRPKPIRKVSKTMSKRIRDWRKTAQETCTVNGQLYCALCGMPIIDGMWDAHHYKERRGQAHSIDNDKYVAALHRYCHNSIDHYSEDYEKAREKIEKNIKKFFIKKNI